MINEKHLLIKNWLPKRSGWSQELMIANNHHELDVICLASGKTGSTTLAKSFHAMGCNTLHVHTTQYFIKNVVREQRAPYDDFVLMDFINYLVSTQQNRQLYIIDAFRDSIDRKISAFFQLLQRVFVEKINHLDEVNRDWKTFNEYYLNNIDILVRHFNNNFLVKIENYYGYDEWKNDGLSIAPGMFDQEKKYTIYNHKGKVYFLLRFDQIHMWEAIFQKNGFPSFKLTSSNLSAEKDYSELYRKFKKNFFFDSREQLDIIFENSHKKRYETFLTPSEFDQLKGKWYSKVR